jgi:hypothetical protein
MTGKDWQTYLKDRAVAIILDALGTVDDVAREDVLDCVFRHFCRDCGKQLDPGDPTRNKCHCTNDE